MSFVKHFDQVISGEETTDLLREYLDVAPQRGRKKEASARSDTEVVVAAFTKIREVDPEFNDWLNSQIPEILDAREKIYLLYTKESKSCPYGTIKTYYPSQYKMMCSRSCACSAEKKIQTRTATREIIEAQNSQRNWICEAKADDLSLADIVANKEAFTAYCRNKSVETIMNDLKISKPLLNYYISKYELT